MNEFYFSGNKWCVQIENIFHHLLKLYQIGSKVIKRIQIKKDWIYQINVEEINGLDLQVPLRLRFFR